MLSSRRHLLRRQTAHAAAPPAAAAASARAARAAATPALQLVGMALQHLRLSWRNQAPVRASLGGYCQWAGLGSRERGAPCVVEGNT